MYLKMHHSLIDGMSGMRLILRALSTDPEDRSTPAFWAVGTLDRPRADESGLDGSSALRQAIQAGRDAVEIVRGLGGAALDLGSSAVHDRPLQAPVRAPSSALQGHLGGQRRFATQQYDLGLIKSLAKAADCTLNDVVLYLCGSALRRYLSEHDRLPDRPLTAGIPVNLREAGDESMGTVVGVMVAELGTNIADPRKRLEAIKRSTEAAKRHLAAVPPAGRAAYTLLVTGPYIAGLVAGLGGRSPVPFNVGISNVPGPPEPLYFNGSRLDAMFPLSLLFHGNALNITCLSYAGTLNFGFTGARDSLPHLQHLAVWMGEAVDEIADILLPRRERVESA